MELPEINWSAVGAYITGAVTGIGPFLLALVKSRREKKAHRDAVEQARKDALAQKESELEKARREVGRDATAASEGIRDDLQGFVVELNKRVTALTERVGSLEASLAQKGRELDHEREYSRELLDYGYRHRRADAPPPPKRSPLPL